MNILELFKLDGRVALVTGASSGLGAGFASGLAEAGASVVLAARRASRLEKTANEIRARGYRALTVETDVADPEACTAAVDAAMAEYGRLDILVNNAGVGTAHPAAHELPEDFRRVIDINLAGSYWMAQACARVMGRGASIVNISSIVGLRPQNLPQAAYASSKAGLIGLTRDLALQWTGRKGIRVNCIAPGYFASEMAELFREGFLDTQLARVPLGRQGEMNELTATLVWLASDAGGYVTGQTIVVDGGFLIG